MLGVMLLFPDTVDVLIGQLTRADFFRGAHAMIFEEIVDLRDKGSAVDIVTLKNSLGRAGKIDQVGGPAYLASMIDGVPRSTNYEHYARMLQGYRIERELLYMTGKITAALRDGELEGRELLRAVDSWLLDIEKGRRQDDIVTPRQAIDRIADDMQRRYSSRQKLGGVTTGIKRLDDWTRGLQPRDLIIIAARPSMGKTSLAFNIARAAAQAGVVTAGFSLEMSRDMIEYRILSDLADVPMFRMLSGWVHADSEWTRISGAYEARAGLPIYIDDSARMSPAEIRSKCRRIQSKFGLGLVVIDFVQRMRANRPDQFKGNRNYELADISNDMKNMAVDLNVPVLLLSQLARVEGRRPLLSDLRDSGALEQDADVVMFIYQEGDRDTIVSGDAEIIIGKQRNGPTATVMTTFSKECTRFGDHVPQTQATDASAEAQGQVSKTSARGSRRRLPKGPGMLPDLSEAAPTEREFSS